MGKPATLVVQVISDGSQAGQGFDQAESAAQRFERGLDRASVAAGGVLAGVGALAVSAFNSASELQQQAGAVEAVYAASADAVALVQRNAAGAADSVGLASSEYNRFASVVGSQLQNMGFSVTESAEQGDALIRMGADLAAQFGGSTSEAVSALSSLMRGERDPIERYAVSMSQAAIDAKVAALGLDTSTESAKKNAQAQATLALLTEQTASAQGAFSRESDTAAGAQARATANWENAKAVLGEQLLPLVSQGATLLADLSRWAQENSGTVQVLAGVVVGLAGAVLAVNGAIKTYRAVATVATAAQWLLNSAFLANPVGLVVVAIAGLVAGVVVAYNKFSWFRDMVGWVWDKLKALGNWVKNNPVTQTIAGLFSSPELPADDPRAARGGAGAGGGTFGAPGAAGGATSPALFGAPGDGGMGSFGGSFGTAQVVAGGDTYNITISGLLDDQAAADRIEDLLRGRGIRKGSTAVVEL